VLISKNRHIQIIIPLENIKGEKSMNYNEILSEHKIVRVVTRRARTRYPRLYGKNSRLPEHRYGREFKILEIYTDKGAYAWSEGWCKEDQKDLLLNKKVSEVFDVYKGAQVEAGKKSIAYALTLRSDEKTLQDTEIDEIMKKVINGLEKDGITLRK
jgi:hypothetical protein